MNEILYIDYENSLHLCKNGNTLRRPKILSAGPVEEITSDKSSTVGKIPVFSDNINSSLKTSLINNISTGIKLHITFSSYIYLNYNWLSVFIIQFTPNLERQLTQNRKRNV